MLTMKLSARHRFAVGGALLSALLATCDVYADEPAIVPSDSSAQLGSQPAVLTQISDPTPEVAALMGSPPLPEDTVTHSRSQIQSLLPAGFTPVYSDTLAILYAARNMQPMWQDEQAVRDFQRQLAEVALAGFQPQFARWAGLLANPNLQGLSRDVVLSDAALGYLFYVSSIQVQGQQWLYGGRSTLPGLPALSVINQWQRASADGSLTSFVRSLAPQNPQYATLRKSMLAELNQDTGNWPQLTSAQTLRPGQWSAEVGVLRDILARNGVLNSYSPQTARAGYYDAPLVAAVRNFQQWQGLAADGVLGSTTRYWLNMGPAQRAALLALNMQRLRLLPDNANGILVNIPDFSLNYYQDGKVVLASRVIVGRPDRKTPLMSSALNNVVVNPPWNVPPSLARKDLLPKLTRDPGYLDSHGFTVMRGWGSGSEPLNPYQIDWQSYSQNNLPFRFQQKPGARNALGRYKFNMPSSDAIYLHDTPNHNLFQKDVRALSSGCVRVNKASELAAMLLGDAGWDKARISTALEAGKSRYVNIPDRIPVNLYYLTAFVGDNGMTQFRTDIYNYDLSARSGATALKNLQSLLR